MMNKTPSAPITVDDPARKPGDNPYDNAVLGIERILSEIKELVSRLESKYKTDDNR